MAALGSANRQRYDAVIVGGGHNGLVAATMLADAGLSVVVLERREHAGGAAISGTPFEGVDARLSRYSYLVSLFPASLIRALGLNMRLAVRRIASYTPNGDGGLLVDEQAAGSFARLTGNNDEFERWERFYAMLGAVAEKLFPTMTEPLRAREQVRELVADDHAWEFLFERPLCEVLENSFANDLVRGVVLTDATIGTFAAADDPELRQNRCFLYHVIGNGTGRWDVPVGGMGAVSAALEQRARAAGVEIRTGAEVVAIDTDGAKAEARCADGSHIQGRHLLANIAPARISQLLRDSEQSNRPEGSQLKLNMLLKRLPRLRDPNVTPEEAFAGTFHVNEGYDQLQLAYERASQSQLPDPVPCELYCHSLTDPSILGPELRAAGAQTLTVFALHMPARLFDGSTAAKEEAVAATLRSINSVLDEPIEDCLWSAPDGSPCLEAVTPQELEQQLGMPGGHIFHRDLAWPFAESEEDVGKWGVETQHANVWLCGAGARRGGGVSGIAGHNAARAVLATAVR